MDQHCVVLCGLQAEASGDAAAWQPVAAALKLDPAEFARRVVDALPRIVRQDLDRGTADRIAQLLHAMQVDARVLPDDPQLVYIERAGASRGPLPLSSLGEFVQPGESYRLHGSTEWQPWPAPGDGQPADPDIGFGNIDEAGLSLSMDHDPADELPASSPAEVFDDADAAATVEPLIDTGDEPEPVETASFDAVDQPGDAAPEDTTDTGAEPGHAVPPPLPGPRLSASSSTEPSGDPDPIAPRMEAAAQAGDDELINPSQEPLSPETSDMATAEGADETAPRRLPTGRLVLLVVLAALAVWAYRHWMADTRTKLPPPSATTAQPSDIQRPGPARDASITPASVAPADSATTPPTAATVAASPAVASSTPAPAATASAPAMAGSTPAPAPAAATSGAVPAMSSTRTLPARAATILSAPSIPAPATSTAGAPTH